ncbi:hypothetical protein IJV57_00290 [Candidatus Saccharibacteria bacterium]|nr:hypothetical protein [Candidatus Saccharibacteria bacterium]
MEKRSVAIILSYSAPIVFLIIALFLGWGLTSLSLITILLIYTTYLRAHNFLGNTTPGKYNTLANYTIGATISTAVIMVDIYLIRYQTINRQLFISLYAATIITGLIFTIALFITDHTRHTSGKSYQRINIVTMATSIILLVAILITSLIVDINYTW